MQEAILTLEQIELNARLSNNESENPFPQDSRANFEWQQFFNEYHDKAFE